MKVLMLVQTVVGGGADFERSRQLGMALGRRGHAVTLIASAPRPQIRWSRRTDTGGLVVQSPADVFPARLSQAGLSPVDLLGRWLHILGHTYDVVHTFGPRPVTYFPAKAHRCRAGGVWVADWSDLWGRGGLADLRPWWGRATLGWADHLWEGASRHLADGLTVVSTGLEQLAVGWGIPPERILRIGLGSNTLEIVPQDKPARRREHGLDASWPVVLYSGQSKVDWPRAAEVLSEVMRVDPSVRVLLVGGDADAMRRSLEGPLQARVFGHPYGSQKVLADLMACADVSFVPFPDIGFNRLRLPNRLGDSLAAGRPVITNDTGDAGDIVRQEAVGLAVPDTPQAMASAIANLLDDRPGRIAMGRRARQAAERQYAWSNLAGRVEDFYGRLLAL
jgi:glycosyltransferase involved in cell wall biosynthesis